MADKVIRGEAYKGYSPSVSENGSIEFMQSSVCRSDNLYLNLVDGKWYYCHTSVVGGSASEPTDKNFDMVPISLLDYAKSKKLRFVVIDSVTSSDKKNAASADSVSKAYVRADKGVSDAKSASTLASSALSRAEEMLPKIGGTVTGDLGVVGALVVAGKVPVYNTIIHSDRTKHNLTDSRTYVNTWTIPAEVLLRGKSITIDVANPRSFEWNTLSFPLARLMGGNSVSNSECFGRDLNYEHVEFRIDGRNFQYKWTEGTNIFDNAIKNLYILD